MIFHTTDQWIEEIRHHAKGLRKTTRCLQRRDDREINTIYDVGSHPSFYLKCLRWTSSLIDERMIDRLLTKSSHNVTRVNLERNKYNVDWNDFEYHSITLFSTPFRRAPVRHHICQYRSDERRRTRCCQLEKKGWTAMEMRCVTCWVSWTTQASLRWSTDAIRSYGETRSHDDIKCQKIMMQWIRINIAKSLIHFRGYEKEGKRRKDRQSITRPSRLGWITEACSGERAWSLSEGACRLIPLPSQV